MTNGGSDTVTVVDVVNVRVDRVLSVGHNPVAVAESPTRNEVYAVNSGAGGRGLDFPDRRGTTPWPRSRCASSRYRSICGGKFAYAANSGSTCLIVDLKARKEIAQVSTGEEPVAARVSPDGKSLVVATCAEIQ